MIKIKSLGIDKADVKGIGIVVRKNKPISKEIKKEEKNK